MTTHTVRTKHLSFARDGGFLFCCLFGLAPKNINRLKGLPSEMDVAESGINKKVCLKGRGAEIVS
jgi:hypothetical protein